MLSVSVMQLEYSIPVQRSVIYVIARMQCDEGIGTIQRRCDCDLRGCDAMDACDVLDVHSEQHTRRPVVDAQRDIQWV